MRIVIPYPPGGPSDVTTRIVIERAAQSLGQPVLFDNKAGASRKPKKKRSHEKKSNSDDAAVTTPKKPADDADASKKRD